jgi:AcrR family transcriptional regulator
MPAAVPTRHPLRDSLIDAAAKLIAGDGPSALTLRRVAAEVGTSTMAVYTAFGSMPELRRAIRHEGFARLAAELEAVPATDDPVADLWLLGRAYYENAIGNPELYRVAFMEQPLDATDAGVGSSAFASLVAAVVCCIEAGRFTSTDARALATEFWALGHGVIALQLAQLVPAEEARDHLENLLVRFLVGCGDAPEAVRRSQRRARRG